MPRRFFVLYPWRKTTTKNSHCDLPRGENEKPHAGRKKSRFATNLLKTNMPKKKMQTYWQTWYIFDATFASTFRRGCKLGVKCGINHFCSHFLLSWYYFVIYLSKIGAIPVFLPVTHAWPAASKLHDNAKCRCLPYLLSMNVPRT